MLYQERGLGAARFTDAGDRNIIVNGAAGFEVGASLMAPTKYCLPMRRAGRRLTLSLRQWRELAPWDAEDPQLEEGNRILLTRG